LICIAHIFTGDDAEDDMDEVWRHDDCLGSPELVAWLQRSMETFYEYCN
jgi:hypothetical protein